MSEFTPIETQEDFDKAIKSRLAQKDRELAEKYKDFLSPDSASALKADFEKQIKEANDKVKEAQDKLKTFDDTVSELTKRAESAELSLTKSKVAYEHKLPLELASRLIGTTEEELNKDAESLSGLIKPASAAPMYSTSKNNPSGSNDGGMSAVLQQVNSQLFGNT